MRGGGRGGRRAAFLPVGEALDEELVDDVAQRPPEEVAAGHGAREGGRKKLPEPGDEREGGRVKGKVADGRSLIGECPVCCR